MSGASFHTADETGSNGQPRPPVTVSFEPRFCANHVVDLTAGCSFGCLYCPFAAIGARLLGVSRPTALDLSRLTGLTPPPSVFLSPASDAFAPQAVESTHTLLSYLLSRGTTVGIVTKGIVPERTLALLADYRPQVEGVAVGVTSLDDHRNTVLEPGCPPARRRLDNIDRLAARGLPAALRLHPLLPVLDRGPGALTALVAEGARRGGAGGAATYGLAVGRHLRRLQRELPKCPLPEAAGRPAYSYRSASSAGSRGARRAGSCRASMATPAASTRHHAAVTKA